MADLVVLVFIFSVIALAHVAITSGSANSGTAPDPYFTPPRVF